MATVNQPTHLLNATSWQWPRNRNVFLILDGVRVKKIAQRLYTWSDGNLNAELLYAGTPLSSLNDISPWLIQLSGPQDLVLKSYLAQGTLHEWGYLIESDASLTDVAKHYRQLLVVLHPLGTPMMLRVADPAVIAAMLPNNSSTATAPWGPIQQLHLPDAVKSAWQHPEPGHSATAPLMIDVSGYQLSEEQHQRLQACNRRRDIRHLMTFVEQHHDGWPCADSALQRFRLLALLVEDARHYGFNSPKEWALLCTLMARLNLTSWEALEQHSVYPLLIASSDSALQRLKQALATTSPKTGSPNTAAAAI
ncbi:DUF4123 domain-containing protein [Vreelandella titanicae]|uniref:DUF4123 domain-containing protein n=1 Tax=Vreelandella titanicae TaxID=664683 RepID=UPI00315AB284